MHVTPTTGFLLLSAFLFLAGCITDFQPRERPIPVDEAQACAIGYDLAGQIHETIRVKDTVILKRTGGNACERHALIYLERAGFTIVDPEIRRPDAAPFKVTVNSLPHAPGGFPTVRAVATVGDGLRVARTYRPVRTGVVPRTPFAVQHLNPDSYERVESWRWWER